MWAYYLVISNITIIRPEGVRFLPAIYKSQANIYLYNKYVLLIKYLILCENISQFFLFDVSVWFKGFLWELDLHTKCWISITICWNIASLLEWWILHTGCIPKVIYSARSDEWLRIPDPLYDFVCSTNKNVKYTYFIKVSESSGISFFSFCSLIVV